MIRTLFKPYHTPAIEFSILNKNNNLVLTNASSKKITSLPDKIIEGHYTYTDGRRFSVSTKGFNSACLAYVVDFLWNMFKHNYLDIPGNKLWLRPMVPTEGEYKEVWWDIVGGKEITITNNGFSPQSFHTFPSLFDSLTENQINRIVKVWNAYVGIPWVLLDRDPLATIRARLLQPYGKYKLLEIAGGKTLAFPNVSSAALFSPASTWLIYALSREAIGIALDSSCKDLVEKLPEESEVSEVINTHSLSGALELWGKSIRTIGISYNSSPYTSAFWINSLPTFEYIVQNGGIFGFGTNPIKNWCLERPEISGHCSTLMAWERTVNVFVQNHYTHKTPPIDKTYSEKIEQNSAKKLEEIQHG